MKAFRYRGDLSRFSRSLQCLGKARYVNGQTQRASESVWLSWAVRFANLYTIGKVIPDVSGIVSFAWNVYCGFWVVSQIPSPLKLT